jgi:hypothetical protein
MTQSKARATRISNILHDIRIADIERYDRAGDEPLGISLSGRAAAILAQGWANKRNQLVEAAADLIAEIERLDNKKN